MADRMLIGRLVMAASIVVLLALGAVRPDTYPLWQVTVLIPGLFLLIALALLFLPVLAEWEAIPWGKVKHFWKHSNFVWMAGAFVLGAAAFVAFMHYETMATWERVVFIAAVLAGLGSLMLQDAIGIVGRLRARPRDERE